jgi:hypothetical protein
MVMIKAIDFSLVFENRAAILRIPKLKILVSRELDFT